MAIRKPRRTGCRCERSTALDDFGRTVTVEATTPLEAATKAKQFADSLDVPARDLNDASGRKIVTLIVKVDAPDGSPLVRTVMDYALAEGVSSLWTAR